MAKKSIQTNDQWPFYQEYHDSTYIISHDNRNEVVLMEPKQRKSRYKLINENNIEIVVYRVDGGIISRNEECKCDFAIYSEKKILILVELKGGEYKHALEQLLNTIKLLFAKPEVKVQQLNARVVLSRMRVPNIQISKEKQLIRLLKTKYGNGNFDKKTQYFEEKI